MELAVDKLGRIVIPKEIRSKYCLIEGRKFELVEREDRLELIPLAEEDDVAIHSLKGPCKTGNIQAHDGLFQRYLAIKVKG